MHRITQFYRRALKLAGLCCLLVCVTVTAAPAAEQAPADKEYSITGELQGVINYGDAFGFVVSDANSNKVNIAMGNGDIEEFQDVTIGSVISLRYTTTVFTPEADSLWPHKSISNFYVDKSGRILKKAPPMGWNEPR